MRLCRYDDNRIGVVHGDEIRDVTPVLDALPSYRWPFPQGDVLIANLPALRPRIVALAATAPSRKLAEARLLSPVANPSKIINAPVNYRRHHAESQIDSGINFGSEIKAIDTYGLFLKATSALVGPGEGVALRHLERRNDHEGEMVVVIGKTGTNIARADALDHVAGYSIGLDMTLRGTEDRSLRKSPDSYAVVGPYLVTREEITDPDALDLTLHVNGELRQSSNTRHLIYDVRKLIEYASSFYTLHPGDIILTGTPEGVGPVKPGDLMRVAVAGIGSMDVAVRAA